MENYQLFVLLATVGNALAMLCMLSSIIGLRGKLANLQKEHGRLADHVNARSAVLAGVEAQSKFVSEYSLTHIDGIIKRIHRLEQRHVTQANQDRQKEKRRVDRRKGVQDRRRA